MRIRIITWLVLAVLILISSAALFQPEFFRPHDFLHGARTAEMARMLSEGQLPPRWSGSFGYGYGMPLFQFYAPLPYFLAGMGVLAGVPLLSAVQLLFFVTTVAAAVGSFQLGKALFGAPAGWVLAALYTLAPYRAVNLYVRGAISESWAMAAYPWIALSLVGIYQRHWWGRYLFLSGLVVLCLSHNISLVLFAPVIALGNVVLLALVWVDLERRKHWRAVCVDLVIGGSLAIALSSFYLIPAFVEKSFTQVESRIAAGDFSYEYHFVYVSQLFAPKWGFGGSIPGAEDGLSFFLGYPQILVLSAATVFSAVLLGRLVLRVMPSVLLGATQPKRLKSLAKTLKTFADAAFLKSQKKSNARSDSKIAFDTIATVLLSAVAAGTVFLSLRQSAFLWNLVPVLAYVQFPWRWHGVSALLVAVLGAFLFARVVAKRWQLSVALTLSAIIVLLHAGFFQPEQYLTSSDAYYFSDPDRITHEFSEVLPDYFPSAFAESSPPASLLYLAASEDSAQEKSNQLSLPKADSEDQLLRASDDLEIVDFEFAVIENRAHYKKLQLTLSEPNQLVVAIADFPGWRASLNNTEIAHHTSPTGLITFLAPAGSHQLELKLLPTPVRSISDVLSATAGLALLVVLLSSILQRVVRRKTSPS